MRRPSAGSSASAYTGPKADVVSVDEKMQMQALSRTQPLVTIRPGLLASRGSTSPAGTPYFTAITEPAAVRWRTLRLRQ